MRRWSPASRWLGAAAAVLGLATFVLVHGYAARVRALSAAFGRPVPVAVAAREVSRGTPLSEDMVRIRLYPRAFAPPGALQSRAGAVGRVALASLLEGEPLTRSVVGQAGAGPLASLVPPGLRAFTIPTPLPPGSVHAGDVVDVLATFAGGHPHVETLAEGVEVLMAGDAATGQGPESGSSLTGSAGGTELVLAVRPDQAEQLAYARAFAELTVTLAGPEEVVAAEGP